MSQKADSSDKHIRALCTIIHGWILWPLKKSDNMNFGRTQTSPGCGKIEVALIANENVIQYQTENATVTQTCRNMVDIAYFPA